MSIFECANTRCPYGCKLEIAVRRGTPKKCQYTGMDQSWKEVEPARKPELFGNSETVAEADRPAKLPNWCKVGEWVFVDPEKVFGHAGYKKIKATDGLGLIFADGCCIYFSDKIKPARLRPYNAEEMKALVGKVLISDSRSTPFSFLVVYAEGDGSFVESYRFKYSAEELKGYFTIDGKPCGVLEHLEDGEWEK